MPAQPSDIKNFGGVWPPHCVQGTRGSEFHADRHLPAAAVVVSKGMGAREDAYSAFQARDDEGVLLGELLRRSGVKRVFVMGLATDYCVKASAIGAIQDGLHTVLVADGARPVNLEPEDGDRAIQEM